MHYQPYLRRLRQIKQSARGTPTQIRRLKRSHGFQTGLLLLLAWTISFTNARPAAAQSSSGNQQTYSLSGSVVNSATGEAVPHALVRTNGTVQRNAFSDPDGHFQFDGMPQCQITVTAQKPGFVSEQDVSLSDSGWINVGPNSNSVTVRLVPQSAIYGRVTDSAGLPIEHLPLRLTARSLREGRRRWEPRGMTETDEDGHFRFPGLMPGTYYLAAGPRQGEMELLREGQRPKTGFPHVYYPGVPDLASASPIQLAPGLQTETDMSLSAVPLYQVTGVISGHQADQGVGFQVMTPSGDELSLPTNFNMETGVFNLEDVPGGNYILRALSQSNLQSLRAEMKINVVSNMEGVRLTLSPAVSIPLAVRIEAHASTGSNSGPVNPQRPPLTAHLMPADINATEVFSNYDQGSNGLALQNVDFGTYTVDLKPRPPWYVQSAMYGQTNVLYDDISVSPGQSYSLDVVLRDDSASISGTLKAQNGTPQRATIVVLPQPSSKVEPHTVQISGDSSFNVSGLAPGEYLVFAFDRVDGIEYASADAMDAYASQAAHVTLTPNQQAQVQLDLIHAGKAD